MTAASRTLRTIVWVMATVAGGVDSLRGNDEFAGKGDFPQAKVVEVSGEYAKVALADASLTKGDAAVLLRGGDEIGTAASGVVTSVRATYVVVRFEGQSPHAGDVVRFRTVPRAPTESDEEPSDGEDPDRKSPRERLAERRARLEAERKKQAEEEHQKWLARLAARGVEAWKPPTDQEHATALETYQRMGAEVQKLLPTVQLYETEYFLFYSNIPPNQVAPYIRYLDAMYVMMARLFGVQKGQDVWLGRKAPVFAFLTREQFLGFEQKYFQAQPVGAYGICHQRSTGEVVIACYRGDDPDDFGQMLVHETSHGFVFRYKSKASLPTWADEGMAEYIGEKLVPASDIVRNKERAAAQQLKDTLRVGSNFFDLDARLEGWQYGVASSMTKLLVNHSQARYVAFIEGMKEGVPWQEALQQAYGASPQELLFMYARAIGVPALGL